MILRALTIAGLIFALWVFAQSHPVPIEQPPASRWIKISAEGQPMAAWAGPWACVYDTQTQRLWEVKTDNESIHDGYWTYSWYDNSRGVQNQGDCYFEKARCDTRDLIVRANREKTCGLDQWRLPDSKELLSLVSREARPGEPLIPKDFFPHTQRGDYWTQDAQQRLTGTFAHLQEGALAVNFIRGQLSKLPYRNASFVRLVNTGFSLEPDKKPSQTE